MQRFVLLLLMAHAHASFTQSINWITACTDRVFCLNPGSCNQGDVSMAEKAVTTCAGGFLSYSYKIDLNNNGSIDIQASGDTISGPFPVGTHKVIWRANDNCGNLSTACSYLFTIRDCNPPNLLCRNGLTQNLELPDCQATFNVSDFIITLNDNCTPTNQIQKGMRETGTGTGFPTAQSLSFGICEQGLHVLEIWVRDGNNLVNQCNSYVLVQDNAGTCECNISANLSLTGCPQSADSAKLDDYTIRADLQGTVAGGPPVNSFLQKVVSDSCYTFSFNDLPLNGAYQGVVKGWRSGDPLNGVSTFDLVLINKHILGQQPLQNFYQVLAADVNQSHSITTFDIVEIRKLILGVYDTFPSVPSWRLIRPVPDPSVLTAYDAVRDTYQFYLPNLMADTTLKGFHFIGVKMGDANSNAALTGPVEDRGDTPVLPLDIADRSLQPGEGAWVPIRPAEAVRLDGWQLALQVDPDALDIRDVQGLAPDEAVWMPSGELRLSAVYDTPVDYGPDAPLVQVFVVARKPVQLSQVLLSNTGHLAAEAYPSSGRAVRPMVLRRGQTPAGGVTFYPPQPNPFAAETTFGLWSEQEETPELEVFDLSGREVYHFTGSRSNGYQALTLAPGALPGPGVWAYRLRAGAAVSAGRLVRL